LIQAYGRHGIGSGHLLLGHCTILYVPFAVEAAKSGGLGAVAGLTIIAGLTEVVLSRCLRVLRPYVPPEIIGLVITLLGIALGMFGLKLMIGAGPDGPVSIVRRRMIWNSRADFVADGLGSSGSGYAA